MKKYQLLALFVFALGVTSIGHAADVVKDTYKQAYTKERFQKADTNGDGFLTLEEAAAASKRFEGMGGRHRFEAADTNGDGLLSLEEASARRAKEIEHGAKAAKKFQDKYYNKERFQEADTDGDGFLTWEEAAAAAKRFEGIEGRRRFEAADTNGDGKLSLEEASQQRKREKKAF